MIVTNRGPSDIDCAGMDASTIAASRVIADDTINYFDWSGAFDKEAAAMPPCRVILNHTPSNCQGCEGENATPTKPCRIVLNHAVSDHQLSAADGFAEYTGANLGGIADDRTVKY